MKRLLQFSIISAVVVVFVTLLSSSAMAAPTSSVSGTQQLTPQRAECGYLCGWVALPPGTDMAPEMVQLYLYEVTSNFVPHVAEWTISGQWSDCGMPFGLWYDSSRINPDSEYAMSAVVRDGSGALVFISNDTLSNKVITLGNPTRNIKIQLENAPQPIP